MIRACVLLTALLGCFAPAAAAAPGNGLVAHRAVYDLSLVKATDRSGIDSMVGRMVYEFNGSRCDGYTTRFRLITKVVSGDTDRMTDQQSTTYENLETRNFRFDTRSFLNNALDKEVRGSARDGEEKTTVDLQKPLVKHLELPLSRFPTSHMLEMIARARAGDRFYRSRIFDGSNDADRSTMTTTVLGAERHTAASDAEAHDARPLSGLGYWPATVAYFDGTSKGDETPSYQISFKLYANGVTRDLTMDYGDFVLHGTLKKLQLLKSDTCTR